jgi:hypothetical protein
MLLTTIRRRFILAIMFVLFLTMLLPLNSLPRTAFAQGSSVTLNPTQGPAGTQVTGTGSNWSSGDTIVVQWDDNPPTTLATTTVQGDGTFTVSFTIPSNATQGNHTIYFTDQTARYFIPATFTVTASASAPITLQAIDVQNGNGQSQNHFHRGDVIHFVFDLYDRSDFPFTVTVHGMTFSGSYYLLNSTNNIDVPGKGDHRYYWGFPIPNDAPLGVYYYHVVMSQSGYPDQDKWATFVIQ